MNFNINFQHAPSSLDGFTHLTFDAIDHRYGSGTVNSNTVNSKFHLIQSFFEIFATFLLFHV